MISTLRTHSSFRLRGINGLPNIRDFVGCAWIVALSEYAHLLPWTTVSRIEESLRIATKGNLCRVGGVDRDDLYQCDSDPWLMRTVLQNWVGSRPNDANLTRSGEKFARNLAISGIGAMFHRVQLAHMQ